MMESYMCAGSCNTSRSFFTKEEKVKMLRDYQKQLENEAKGVAERVKEMESK